MTPIWESLVIRPATVDDADAIALMSLKAREGFSRPTMNVVSDEIRVRRKLSEGCFGWVVEDSRGPVGFHLFEEPRPRDREDGLGEALGIQDDDWSRILVLDSLAVLPPYRGNGLAGTLLDLGEVVGRARGRDLFVTTVDPENAASLRHHEKAGYRVAALIKAFSMIGADGVLREGEGFEDVPHVVTPLDRYVLVKGTL